MLKYSIKRSTQWLCATLGPHTRAPSQPTLLILMYHRILPLDDERARLEEPGMIVTPSTFRAHLGYIKNYFQPVQLEDWGNICTNGRNRPGLSCAITFDDGWADNYEYAFPILQEFDMPATIFLVTDMIGTRNIFWPEMLARTLFSLVDAPKDYRNNPAILWLQALLPTNIRDFHRCPDTEELSSIINRAKSFTDEEIHQNLSAIISAHELEISPDKQSLLDWDQVLEMTESGLINIASHTRKHIRLGTSTPDSILADEIIGSKVVIEKMTGLKVNSFCFPNGDYSPQALKLVKENYRYAVTTRSGWNTCGSDPHLLQRVAIHEDIAHDRTAFLSRISGWL